MKLIVLIGLLVVASAPARAQDVSVDYDHAFDFSKVSTFAAQVATSWNNPFGEQRVLAEVEEAIVAKGWVKADPDTADAIVLLHGATEARSQLNAFYSGRGGWGWRGMGAAGGSATVTESAYTVGTLVVDIYDAASKQLIFRGVASDELSDKPEKNQKKVEKATAKMFKNFPPAAED